MALLRRFPLPKPSSRSIACSNRKTSSFRSPCRPTNWLPPFTPSHWVRAVSLALLPFGKPNSARSEEHTSELQSHLNLVCRLLLEKKNIQGYASYVADYGIDKAGRSHAAFQHAA